MTAMEENPGTVGTSHPEFGKATTATEVAAALSSTIRGKNGKLTTSLIAMGALTAN